MSNLFEKATKNKFRFTTVNGQVTVEDLWDIPLLSNNGLNLDNIAIQLSRELKETEETSFVVKPTPKNTEVGDKFKIVKYIIGYKLKVAETAKLAGETRARNQRIMELIEKKKDEALSEKSVEELTALIEGS